MDLPQLFFDESSLGSFRSWIEPRSTQVEPDRSAVPRSFVIGGIVLALVPIVVAVISLARNGLALS